MKFVLLLITILTISSHADPRVVHDTKDFPFVARIVNIYNTRTTSSSIFSENALKYFNQAKQKGYDFFISKCTGSLIRTNVVLTAGHCVSHIKSEVNIAETYPYMNLVVEFPGHTEDPVTVKTVFYIYVSSPERDWALLILDQHIHNIKPIKIASVYEEITPDKQLISIGFDGELFGSGLETRPLLVDECRTYAHGENNAAKATHQIHPKLLATNCYTRPGNSGGPVISKINEEYQLVGVNILGKQSPYDWVRNWSLGYLGPDIVSVMVPTNLLPEYLMKKN